MVNIYLGTETSICTITFLVFKKNFMYWNKIPDLYAMTYLLENCAEIACYPSKQVSIILCLLIEYKKL